MIIKRILLFAKLFLTIETMTNGKVKSYFHVHIWFGVISLFNGISTFVGYLMPKPFF